MNLELFTEAIQIMCNALPTTQQANRIKALYEFFGDKDYFTLKNAARLVAQEAQNFPTPATFRDFYSRCLESKCVDTAATCSYCNGHGWTMIDGLAHRGACEHGDRLSQKIKRAPDGHTNTLGRGTKGV